MGIIYIATNIINNKCYIGQTRHTIYKRKSEHIYDSKNNKTSAFHSAIKKYGKDNFTWKILKECDDSLLNKYEDEYINEYNTFSPNGYNITFSIFIPPKDTSHISQIKREKSSQFMKEHNPMFNSETRKKMGLTKSKQRIGKSYNDLFSEKVSNEIKLKASNRMKKDNPMFDPEIVNKAQQTKKQKRNISLS